VFDVKRRKTPHKYADVNSYLEESVVLSSSKCSKEMIIVRVTMKDYKLRVGAYLSTNCIKL